MQVFRIYTENLFHWSSIQLQKTKREFEGDITLVVFPLLGISGKAPEVTGQEIGAYLQEHVSEVVCIQRGQRIS